MLRLMGAVTIACNMASIDKAANGISHAFFFSWFTAWNVDLGLISIS
jgi:hypothetical protein